jgi:hypothetical protein
MRVALDQLRSDMALAADIVDTGGRLLLPKGTVLTEKHLRYCQMWGIADADIQGGPAPSEPAPAAIDPARLEAAENRLRPRFRHLDLMHPVIAALFRHAAEAGARTTV